MRSGSIKPESDHVYVSNDISFSRPSLQNKYVFLYRKDLRRTYYFRKVIFCCWPLITFAFISFITHIHRQDKKMMS